MQVGEPGWVPVKLYDRTLMCALHRLFTCREIFSSGAPWTVSKGTRASWHVPRLRSWAGFGPVAEAFSRLT